MNWLQKTLSSTLGKKVIMSLSGLFLIIFLIGHLAGNLQLYIRDGGEAFNKYGEFMSTNPLIKILSYTTYISILVHIIYSILITIYNKRARPIGYVTNGSQATSRWASRNMGILGTCILIFLVIHLQGIWYKYRFGDVPMVSYNGIQLKDLYTVTIAVFTKWYWVVLYTVCMITLAFHLSHGFASAFQTLGLNHKKYTPFIKKIGLLFSLIVPAAFASIPIYIYFMGVMNTTE